MKENTWYQRPGWGLAHTMRLGMPHRTVCGKKVNTDHIEESGPTDGDKCKACERIARKAKA